MSKQYSALEKSAAEFALNAKNQLNFYQIFWCDLNIKEEENQYYIQGFKKLGFLNVQEFETIESLLKKIDMRKTQKTIILLTSGSIAEQISKQICDEAYPLRKGKVLDHLVFCGWKQKYEPFIKNNPLSLAPRDKKLSIEFEELEKMILDSIKEIVRIQADEEKSKVETVNKLMAIPENYDDELNVDTNTKAIAPNSDYDKQEEIAIDLLTVMPEEPDSSPQIQVQEENKNDQPKDIMFGKQIDDYKCNVNIYSALKKHKMLRNGEPFWPYTMDNDMHLCGITFQEAQILTKALCQGFEAGAKKFVKDLNAVYANPNMVGASWVAKKQINEWKDSGHDASKIEESCQEILKKAAKTAKQLNKNCNEDTYQMVDDGSTIFNWHRLPLLCIKLYTQGTWLTWRCEEMMWSPFNQEMSNDLGLWQGMIQGLIYTGVVERPDEDNKVSLSSWVIPEKLFDCIYKTMYISDEMLQNIKDIADGPGDEETKTIKVQGIFSCAINLEISLSKGHGIKSGNKVLFKVRMNTQYSKGDDWSDDRKYENQTGMLLGTGLQKDNCHIAILYEPEMTVNQVQFNANDGMHTIELQAVPSDMNKMDW